MQFSFAQEKTVTGNVSDELGPLPGATVVVKGTTRGVTTDFDGNYSISAKQGDVLEVSFAGKQSKSITVGTSNTYDFVLGGMVGEEIVLATDGYRNFTSARATSAISIVSQETIENRPNASALQTLQGQVAGFNITTGSGQPGAISNTLIRGIGSLNGNTEPLYVIDGVPQSGSSFRALNPEDIEAVNVLKDAVGTSLYGNRGSNGVVVVTTRKGKYGSSQLSVSSTTGISTLQKNYYNKMSAIEILRLEKAKGTGFGSTLSDDEINSFPTNTDWTKELTRDALSKTINVAFSNGGEKSRSYSSINYNETQGLADVSNFARITLRNNLDGSVMNDKLEYGTNISLGIVKDDRVPSLGTGGVNQNPMLATQVSLPYISSSLYTNGRALNEIVRNPSSPIPLLGYTPLLIQDLNQNLTNRFNEFQIFGSGFLKYNITDNLNIKNVVGVDYTQFTTLTTQGAEGFNAVYFAQNDGKPFGGFQQESFQQDYQLVNTFSINYDKTFAEKHSLFLSAFVEGLYGRAKDFNYNSNGLDPVTFYPGDGSGLVPEDPNNITWYNRTAGSNLNFARMLSYFLTADYDFDSKYGVTASVRRDGTYRFAEENRFGNFWSVGARVNLDKMKFMEGSRFKMLKVRASYGSTGNQNIAGQSIFAAPNTFKDLYAFGNAYNSTIGAFPIIGNPDAQWETTYTTNLGVDFNYRDRLRGSLELYERKANDLFNSINTSSISGTTNILGNLGGLKNSGVELSLNYDVIVPAKKDGFRLNVFANGSYNKNEITELPNGNAEIINGNTILEVGGKVNQYYVYKYAGINPNTGNHLFYTADGNLTETPDAADRFRTGENYVPEFQGGFGFNIDIKRFYVSSQFNFVQGVSRFDFDLSSLSDPNSIGQFNLSRDLLNYWTPDNRNTDQPSLNVANQGFAEESDRFLIDASYLRIRNLQVGYNFPTSTFNDKLSLRVFASAENIYTWSKWRGWDAESPRAGDQYQFPTPKIYTLGIQVNVN
jgi:TonB-linked SusC/RagA family outer membrane protein